MHLQKMLLRSLALGRTPGAAVVQYYSFNALAEEISVVLSALSGIYRTALYRYATTGAVPGAFDGSG